MSLDALYSDKIAEGFQRDFAKPPPPEEKSFSLWSATAAGAKGVPAAGLQVGASVAEFLGNAAQESFRRPQLKIFENQPDSSLRRSEDLKLLINAGPVMRQEAATFAPPETAHTADQILFELARVGTKAGLAIAGGGPYAGGAALAAEETNTQYQGLKAKGIDPNTALKVAAVQGVVTGASVALPMVGPTVKSTLGLAAAGGPGAFVAQEVLAKRILEEHGYQNEASLHNPTDPLGLALSTVLPGVFAGVHIAGLRAKPQLSDVVRTIESNGKRFAADGSELQGPSTRYGTAKGDMQVLDATALDPGYGIRPAKRTADGGIDPADRARVGVELVAKFEEKYGSPDKAMAAYNWGPGNLEKAVAKYGDKWLEHAPAETQAYVAKGLKKLGDDTVSHAATKPEVVEAARVRVTNDALARSLPDFPMAHAEVLRARDAVAAGERPEVTPLREPVAAAAESDARLDAALSDAQVTAITPDAAVTRDAAAPATLRTETAPLRTPDAAAPSEARAAAARVADAIETNGGGKDLYQLDAARLRERAASAPEPERPHLRRVADEVEALGRAKPEPAPTPRSEGTNALPDPQRSKVAPARRQSEADAAQPRQQREAGAAEPRPGGESAPDAAPDVASRADAIAAENPDLQVKLPGSDETLTVREALEKVRVEAAEDAKQATWVQAAIECAISFS